MVSCYTGMDGTLIEHLLRRGVAGVVLEGFGAGNVPPGLVPAVEKAIGRGIPVVLTTRCPEGGVWPMYAYAGGGADLRQAGRHPGRPALGPQGAHSSLIGRRCARPTPDISEKVRQIFEFDEDS